LYFGTNILIYVINALQDTANSIRSALPSVSRRQQALPVVRRTRLVRELPHNP
jgi:hypothetical protein